MMISITPMIDDLGTPRAAGFLGTAVSPIVVGARLRHLDKIEAAGAGNQPRWSGENSVR
ncbi:hypothetical protein GIS00_04425 [Nakamurella sp. YIM 132087]|uniref:Uncharacterized protein n=1 Tax=Nakamurella alba TaxID=2665158 RepID=A0A7K1FGG4_9ACTN|nr:hypothetical protein [Nakamurella alba]MTD13192.1 hypothetical protein [Nakamurella alba]